MFGNNDSDILPDFQSVTLASDRGYWMPKFLFNNLLEAGVNIVGTVKCVSNLFYHIFIQFLYI